MEKSENCAAAAAGNAKKKKGKSKNLKKGFSDEQIRLLETMFESETKPDPRRKMELARELGLEPRQVAIWFQNRRARWKSKQVEQEYRVLRASYEKLLTEFESLKTEKQDLEKELQKLSGMLDKNQGGGRICRETSNLEDEDTNCKSEANPIGRHDSFDRSLIIASPDDQLNEMEKSPEDSRDHLSRDDENCSVTLLEKWSNFGSNDVLDYSCSNVAPWWNFWT
ncbi:hypothetical protein BT93_A1215 [Corymbia citriodora subsp. variegata]|nr:hypothetical protein BT93_A1215 [Corymbia citriodora subsp. variegata]